MRYFHLKLRDLQEGQADGLSVLFKEKCEFRYC